MDHNIHFSSFDQIQTPQYPDVHENPLTNDEFEAFMKANDDKINNLETKFDQFQKQCAQMLDDLLNQMRNFMQNFQNGPPGEDKEHKATTDTELFSTEDIQPLPVQEPPQNSDMHQIIEECCFLCIHDDVDDLMESALDSKLLSINSINSQRLDKKEQKIKNVEEQPAEQEADLFLSDDSIPPGIENVADDPEGDVRFLEELLIDDSIFSHELSDDNLEDNPSISRPPPEPPDVEFFFDLKPDVIAEEISDKLNEDKCFDPGREIFVSTNNEDVDHFPFRFVIRIFLPYLILPEISPLFLSAESEDTIFDPGISD
nr:hypothetical protein [Tanacetum cinerariifolium]